MTESVPRTLVEAFYKAYAACDAQKVAEFLHDDVEWTINGPVNVLPFCGTRHGKASVIDLIERLVPGTFHIFSFVLDTTVVDGDRVAALARLAATRSDDGRVISYRLAHFMRFRDGKVIENLSLIDSFDAAEQMLGRSLASYARHSADTGNLVAV